jgi:hypothetical protein
MRNGVSITYEGCNQLSDVLSINNVDFISHRLSPVLLP